MTDESEVNYTLLTELMHKPHKHMNVGDCARYTCEHGHDHMGHGEVMAEARAVQHLCDLAGIPEGESYSAHIDARVWRLWVAKMGLADRLDRIASWHSRETAGGGMVGSFCVTCGERWPCDTRRMADGTYVDEEAP